MIVLGMSPDNVPKRKRHSRVRIPGLKSKVGNSNGGRTVEVASMESARAQQSNANLVSNSKADTHAESQRWTLVRNQHKSWNSKGKNQVGSGKGHVHVAMHEHVLSLV